VDTNEIVLSISSAAKSARNSLAIRITAINSDRKKGIRISLKRARNSLFGSQRSRHSFCIHVISFLIKKQKVSTVDLVDSSTVDLVDMMDWKRFPDEIQDRILTFYKWENVYMEVYGKDHAEVWDQLDENVMATEHSAEGDWAGEPAYEKFKVLRPNMTTMVYEEFWPIPEIFFGPHWPVEPCTLPLVSAVPSELVTLHSGNY